MSTDQPPVDNPIPRGGEVPQSLIVVNTGDGKGKSSAAFGVMVRAIARDWRVAVVQFIKSGDWKVGEEKVGRQLGVDWYAIGEGFTWDSEDLDHDRNLAAQGWRQAKALIESGDYELIILDEITYLMTWEWIDTAEVIATLENRPSKTSIVCTGRDAPQRLTDVADTVTEMVKLKHAYDNGKLAKRGIDY